MKKIKSLVIIVVSLTVIMLMQNKAMAVGSAQISGPSSVESGNSVTVTVTLRNVAAWNISISASGATSGKTVNYADATEDASNTTKSFSFTCQSSGEGTITIKVTGDVSSEDGSYADVNTSKTITVTIPAPPPSDNNTGNNSGGSSSSNNNSNNSDGSNNSQNNNQNSGNSSSGNKNNTNNVVDEKQLEEQRKAEEERKKQEELVEKRLSNLFVNGYELTPSFNMDIEEYTVNLPITEEKITINAEALSSMAKAVEGIGEFKVNEGTNTFEIIVTAGNGEKKTYKINAIVADENPIELEMNGYKYTVIKRESSLTNPDERLYETTKIKINNIEVPAFKNIENGEVVVGVKDEAGAISIVILNDNKVQISEEEKINPFLILTIVLAVCEVISIVIIIVLKKKK